MPAASVALLNGKSDVIQITCSVGSETIGAKARLFAQHVRRSDTADSTPAAVDITEEALTDQIVRPERERRLREAPAGGSSGRLQRARRGTTILRTPKRLPVDPAATSGWHAVVARLGGGPSG